MIGLHTIRTYFCFWYFLTIVIFNITFYRMKFQNKKTPERSFKNEGHYIILVNETV